MEQSKWASPSTFQPSKEPAQIQPPSPQSPSPNVIPAASAVSEAITDSQQPTYPQSTMEDLQSYTLDPSVGEFAQTRSPDDLFSDDFEPIEDPASYEQSATPQRGTHQLATATRGARQHGSSRQRPKATGDGQTAQQDIPRTEAVRGDRSGTGGIKKTKLTEQELSARMEAVKLKNQSLEAAHARAEADQASFDQREAEAQQKRRVERQNRQQMMGEREKNRLRKMKAAEGREWDAEKEGESANSSVRGGEHRQSAHLEARKEVDEFRASDYLIDESRGADRGRGRGRGAGRGRGRGRGQGNEAARGQALPTRDDFPSLPVTPARPTETSSASIDEGSKANEKSWADEMESSPLAAPVLSG